MDDKGQSVTEAVKFLAAIYTDISNLLVCVDDQMSARGWADPYGSVCFWERSKAVYAPSQWSPMWFCRIYGKQPEGGGKPPMSHSPWMLMNVYLKPVACGVPVAVWGLVSFTEQDWWQTLNKIALLDDGPDFLTREETSDWTSLDLPGTESFVYQSCAAVELCNQAVVEERIVQQLFSKVAASC